MLLFFFSILFFYKFQFLLPFFGTPVFPLVPAEPGNSFWNLNARSWWQLAIGNWGFLCEKSPLCKNLSFLFFVSVWWKLVLPISLIGSGCLGFSAVALDRWLGKSREALVVAVFLWDRLLGFVVFKENRKVYKFLGFGWWRFFVLEETSIYASGFVSVFCFIQV